MPSSARPQVAGTFLVADVFDLGSLGRTFGTIIDAGLLHVFSYDLRPRFVSSQTFAINKVRIHE